MNRVFSITKYFRVPDGTLLSPFLNAKDSESGLPFDLLDGFSLAAGTIEPRSCSKIHVAPFVTQVAFVRCGNLVVKMKGPHDAELYVTPILAAGQAVLTEPGTFLQLINDGAEPCEVLYIVSPAYVFEMGPAVFLCMMTRSCWKRTGTAWLRRAGWRRDRCRPRRIVLPPCGDLRKGSAPSPSHDPPQALLLALRVVRVRAAQVRMVAAVWCDKLEILDAIGASWDTIGADLTAAGPAPASGVRGFLELETPPTVRRDGRYGLWENGLDYLAESTTGKGWSLPPPAAPRSGRRKPWGARSLGRRRSTQATMRSALILHGRSGSSAVVLGESTEAEVLVFGPIALLFRALMAPWRLARFVLSTALGGVILAIASARRLGAVLVRPSRNAASFTVTRKENMNMASLMAWIRAGLRSGPRLLFLTLLFGLGAVSMGEFATPARAFIRDTFKSDAPEVSKARASLRELHDLSRTLEGELTTATGQVCEAISSHTRSAEIVKYLEATRAKDSTPEKLEKWDRLIASWKAQMLPSSADQDKLGLVLEALYDVDQSVKRLKAVQGAMK